VRDSECCKPWLLDTLQLSTKMEGKEPKLLGAGADQGDFEVQDLKIFLAIQKFHLKRDQGNSGQSQQLKDSVLKLIVDNDMSHVYSHFCSSFGWPADQSLLETMRAANTKALADLDEKIAESEKNMGDEEVRDAMLAKADYFANIGDRDRAWEAYDSVEQKTPSPNHKITIAFCKIRLEILYGNWVGIKQLIASAKQVCEKGGDWEKKNRLMVRTDTTSGH
jgi:26S proteasome regulatory subunit N7